MGGCRWHLSGHAEGEIFRLFGGWPQGRANPTREAPSRAKRCQAVPGLAWPSRAEPSLGRNSPGQVGPSREESGRAVGRGATRGPRAPNTECFPPRGNHTVWGGWAGRGPQGLAPASRLQANLVLEALVWPENLREPPPRGEHAEGEIFRPFRKWPPGQAEPSQAGLSQAKPSRAAPGREMPSRAEPSLGRARPGRAGPSRAGSGRAGGSGATRGPRGPNIEYFPPRGPRGIVRL